jgi:hypothetical protein
MGLATKQRFGTNRLFRFLPTNITDAAQLIGRTARCLEMWRANEAMLSENQADMIAVRLGLHPSAIWPDWFDTTH